MKRLNVLLSCAILLIGPSATAKSGLLKTFLTDSDIVKPTTRTLSPLQEALGSIHGLESFAPNVSMFSSKSNKWTVHLDTVKYGKPTVVLDFAYMDSLTNAYSLVKTCHPKSLALTLVHEYSSPELHGT